MVELSEEDKQEIWEEVGYKSVFYPNNSSKVPNRVKEFASAGIPFKDLDHFRFYRRKTTPYSRNPYGTRGMYKRNGKLNLAAQFLLTGSGIRATARIAGISKTTARKLYRELTKNPGSKIVCKCGREILHQGWCWYRFSKSEKRQTFMKRWHLDKTLQVDTGPINSDIK